MSGNKSTLLTIAVTVHQINNSFPRAENSVLGKSSLKGVKIYFAANPSNGFIDAPNFMEYFSTNVIP